MVEIQHRPNYIISEFLKPHPFPRLPALPGVRVAPGDLAVSQWERWGQGGHACVWSFCTKALRFVTKLETVGDSLGVPLNNWGNPT
jgi:hypothetical protein